jgi:Skp family chaperone for outer membrane proteins
MLYFICASPMVKIYLPEWHSRLEDNPDLMLDNETQFDFVVRTGTRGIRVAFNTPQQVQMQASREGFNPQVDAENVFQWLTGGPSGTEVQETDIYGIVPFNPQIDMADTFDKLGRLEDIINGDPTKAKKARADYDAMRKNAQERMRAARDEVIGLSEKRIRRAMKFVHNSLVKQWAINEEQKLGKHTPSMTERFGMHALDKEIQAAANKGAALKKKVNLAMQHTSVV